MGETNPYFDVREIVRRYRMEDRVEITGHVTLDEFKRRIDETDIALNIRERTVGETSASLCRLMAAGVCSVVAEAGWYAELPNDSVVKIPLDSHADKLLLAYLERLIEDPVTPHSDWRERPTVRAYEHSLEHRAADYLAFIRELIGQRPRRKIVAGVSRDLSLAQRSSLLTNSFCAVWPGKSPTLIPADIPMSSVIRLYLTPQPRLRGRRPTAKSLPILRHNLPASGGMPKPDGVDYKHAAVEYPRRLDAERNHYLKTKPFYNLANKPTKHQGDGMDAETHRHFCDFANIAVSLGLPAGSRILDVGCGSGWLSEYFARLGYEVKGIDISPALVEMSRDRVASLPYDVDHETALRCSFEVHDIDMAPLTERFDAVLCYDSLHHFEDETRGDASHRQDATVGWGALYS